MLSALEFFIFQKQPLRGVLLEKLFSEISQNWQENICGKVSFSIKLHNERLLLIFLVSSLEDFLLISFQQKNEIKKGKYPDEVQIFTLLLKYRFVWRQIFQKKFDRKCDQKMCLKSILCCSFHGYRNFARERFLGGEQLTSSSVKTV